MINFIVGLGFIGVLTVFWTAIYGTVTSLPFGMQEPMEFFMGIINTIRNLMPWMDTIWTIFVYALIFETSLFFLKGLFTVIKLVRGGG